LIFRPKKPEKRGWSLIKSHSINLGGLNAFVFSLKRTLVPHEQVVLALKEDAEERKKRLGEKQRNAEEEEEVGEEEEVMQNAEQQQLKRQPTEEEENERQASEAANPTKRPKIEKEATS
jgi:hypothetical protein